MRRSSPLGLLYRPHETHEQADAATAPCASVVVVSAQNRPLQLLLDPVPAVAFFFGAIERDGDYDSSAVLKSPRDQPC